MLFFKKKPKTDKPLPVESIQEMSSRGMSDKDVIKSLKSQGYSYEEIEQGMLQAVKQGVSDAPAQPSYSLQPQSYGQSSSYAPSQPAYAPPAPAEQPDFSMPELSELSDVPEEPAMAPETIMEELIEGVIAERWQGMEARLKAMESDIAVMKQKVANVSNASALPGQDDAHAAEAAARLEDLEARIGGLERAFKQFLPSLTKNIESLARIIHEMKARQGRV